jgi:signal transduction histidine kinase
MSLITREYVESQLSSIFEDAIILNYKFEITAVSQTLANEFKCIPSQLIGKNLNFLSKDFDLVSELTAALMNGHFSGRSFVLQNFQSQDMKVALSGFYLGFISDLNETIAIFVKNESTKLELTDKLKLKADAMEDLLYRASHDLRGPIATILGIVNIAKLRKDNTEIDKLFDFIKTNAMILDQRLKDVVAKNSPRELESEC